MKFFQRPLLFILLLPFGHVSAQSLTFTTPQVLLPDAGTDKAIDITNYKGGFFVAWKEPGASGRPYAAYLAGIMIPPFLMRSALCRINGRPFRLY